MGLPVTITSVQQIYDTQPFLQSVSGVTSAVVFAAIGQEESKVWGRLSQRYQLPITPIPNIVAVICIDLTVANLLVKQAILANSVDKSPWPSYYTSVEAYLNMVVQGNVNLLDNSMNIIQGNELVTFFSGTGYTPTFGELPPEYIFPDPNKQRDQIDDRNTRGGLLFP